MCFSLQCEMKKSALGLQSMLVYEVRSQTCTLNPTIAKSPLICSDLMQFCTKLKFLYGAGLPLGIRRSLVWFTLQNSCRLRCTSQRDSWGPLWSFLTGTCRVHPVIAFDSSLVFRCVEPERWCGGRGCWAGTMEGILGYRWSDRVWQAVSHFDTELKREPAMGDVKVQAWDQFTIQTRAETLSVKMSTETKGSGHYGPGPARSHDQSCWSSASSFGKTVRGIQESIFLHHFATCCWHVQNVFFFSIFSFFSFFFALQCDALLEFAARDQTIIWHFRKFWKSSDCRGKTTSPALNSSL